MNVSYFCDGNNHILINKAQVLPTAETTCKRMAVKEHGGCGCVCGCGCMGAQDGCLRMHSLEWKGFQNSDLLGIRVHIKT